MKQDQLKNWNKFVSDVPGLMLIPQTAPKEILLSLQPCHRPGKWLYNMAPRFCDLPSVETRSVFLPL